jgi:sec-independent protein translocase protein TatC
MAEVEPQPFLGHIQELRTRLLTCVAVLLAAASLGYWQRDVILPWVQRPLHANLIYTSPSGGFEYVAMISLAVGLVVALPVICYQLIRFITPAFARGPKVKQRLVRMLVAAYLLAAAGVAFGYYMILPASLRFFASYSSPSIKPLITAQEYLSFTIGCLVTFAILFQLPLIVSTIDRIRPIPPKAFMGHQRLVIVGSLAIALILPFTYDPITQFVIAVPIILLYEVSGLILWSRHSSAARQLRREQAMVAAAQPVVTTPAIPQPVRRQPIAMRAMIIPPTPAQSAQMPLGRRRPIQMG